MFVRTCTWIDLASRRYYSFFFSGTRALSRKVKKSDYFEKGGQIVKIVKIVKIVNAEALVKHMEYQATSHGVLATG